MSAKGNNEWKIYETKLISKKNVNTILSYSI